MHMGLNETTLLFIFSISSFESTALYRFGRKVWTVVAVGTNLLVISLARTIGYVLSVCRSRY